MNFIRLIGLSLGGQPLRTSVFSHYQNIRELFGNKKEERLYEEYRPASSSNMRDPKMLNALSVLGLRNKANTVGWREIVREYRKLAVKYHPDLHPGNAEFVEKMKDLNSAYDELAKGSNEKFKKIFEERDGFAESPADVGNRMGEGVRYLKMPGMSLEQQDTTALDKIAKDLVYDKKVVSDKDIFARVKEACQYIETRVPKRASGHLPRNPLKDDMVKVVFSVTDEYPGSYLLADKAFAVIS